MEKRDYTKEELQCLLATHEHIEMVRLFMKRVIARLEDRALAHDRSKLDEPELALFAKMTPKLATTEFGSEDYKKALAELKPALDHHYAKNRHHPEHFPRGINDMNLIDVIEMICDWKAATLRQHKGNLLSSIDLNGKRFEVSEQLLSIIKNTVELFE